MLGPVFIGGPGRSGTSLIIRLLSEVSTERAYLPVEGWVYKYLIDYPFTNKKMLNVLVDNYLTHGRSTDTKKKSHEAPIESAHLELSDFQDIPHNIKTVGSLLNWVLNKYASGKNCSSWGVKDNHAEFYFKRLMKCFPESKFIIVFRDPRSAICSSMYFGSFPNRNSIRTMSYFFRLTLWFISAHITVHLQKKYPDIVTIVKYEDLIENQSYVQNKLSSFLNEDFLQLTEDLFPKPFSSYNIKNARGFYNTNQNWMNLLSKEEIYIIEKVTSKYMKYLNYEKYLLNSDIKLHNIQHGYLLYLKVLSILSLYFPELVYNFAELLNDPYVIVGKLKQHIKTTLIYSRMLSPNFLKFKSLS